MAVAFMVITRVSAKQADEASQAADIVRVTRRDVGSAVKATGVIKPMVGAEVRVGTMHIESNPGRGASFILKIPGLA